MKSRKKRIKELLERDETLKNAHPLFLHIIPEDQNTFLPLITEEDKTFLIKNFSPIPEGGRSSIYNFEGFKIYSHSASLKPYVQIFRNGAIEYFTNNLVFKRHDDIKTFSGEFLTKEITRIYKEVLRFIEHYNIPFKIDLYLTILNLKGIPIHGNNLYFPDNNNNNDEVDNLYFQKLILESTEDIKKKFALLLDMFWQAGGYSNNLYIDRYKIN